MTETKLCERCRRNNAPLHYNNLLDMILCDDCEQVIKEDAEQEDAEQDEDK